MDPIRGTDNSKEIWDSLPSSQFPAEYIDTLQQNILPPDDWFPFPNSDLGNVADLASTLDFGSAADLASPTADLASVAPDLASVAPDLASLAQASYPLTCSSQPRFFKKGLFWLRTRGVKGVEEGALFEGLWIPPGMGL